MAIVEQTTTTVIAERADMNSDKGVTGRESLRLAAKIFGLSTHIPYRFEEFVLSVQYLFEVIPLCG